MSDSVQKFYLYQESFGEQELRSKENKETEEYPQEVKDNKLSEDVVNILETFRLLKIEEKIIVKKLIKTVDINY